MKSEMPYHGIPTPLLRRALRPIFMELDLPSSVIWQGDVLGLWRNAKFREERYAALNLAADKRAEVLGKGLGRKLVELMLERARSEGVQTVTLDSTITAYRFYERLGFVDTGPLRKQEYGRCSVRGFPMKLNLFEQPAASSQ